MRGVGRDIRWQRVIDVFWISREEGSLWPRGYGVISRYYRGDGTARGTIIPFNLLIGWSLYLYWKVRFGWVAPASWHDVHRAYLQGKEAAWREAYDEGYRLGSSGG